MIALQCEVGGQSLENERHRDRSSFRWYLPSHAATRLLKRVAKRMKEQGKLHSVAIIAIGRRLITIADAFLKTGENGRHQVR